LQRFSGFKYSASPENAEEENEDVNMKGEEENIESDKNERE